MRIIYIDIDCQRPDHLGCYGYHRNTSPNIDAIAEQGVRFTQCHCANSPCVPSRAALFSGRFGIHNGVVTHWGPGSEFRFPTPNGAGFDDSMPMFARHLRRHGYKTVSFSSFADRHLAWWFAAGWSELHTFTEKRGNETADEVNAAAVPWLRAHAAEDNYFLHLHYWDVHRVYRMPKKWADTFADSPPPDWPDQAAIDSHQSNYGPFSASMLFPHRDASPRDTMPDTVRTLDDWKHIVDGYDGAILYADHHIGQIFDVLAEAGVLDDTAVIISADHGEAMGEFGIYGDHVCGCSAVHNIPMIVRWPGGASGEKPGLMYNLDLCPTLCELLDIPVPEGWDGRSFASAVRGEEWHGWDYLVWDHALYSCQRVVRTQDYIYTRTFHPGLFPFEREMLHDARTDLRQANNIASTHRQEVLEMSYLMQEWLHDQLGRHGAKADPMQYVVETGPWKYVALEPWLERLRQLGRDKDAESIERWLAAGEWRKP